MYIKLCYNQEYEREVFEVKLLFKQRLFSWFDSYDIYDETEQTVYVVKGQLAMFTVKKSGQSKRRY